MNKVTLAFFIFQVTFALSDFSPYRGECSRIGNFDIHINGKKLYLFFCSLVYQPDREQLLPTAQILFYYRRRFDRINFIDTDQF